MDIFLCSLNAIIPRLVFYHYKGYLTIKTKIMVFWAMVLSTLLYAFEIWILYGWNIKCLELSQKIKLWRIFHISWVDHITNNEVLSWTSLSSIEAGWVMCWECAPCIILFGELVSSKRLLQGPKHCFKDQLKTFLMQVNIDPETWKTIAANWPS